MGQGQAGVVGGDRPRLPPPEWPVERHRGGAPALLGLGFPAQPARLVRVLEVDRPALVLGSTQPDAAADAARCAAAATELARRSSGGGAVLVESGTVVWVDVILPAGDPLWDGDVGRSFHWLGESWVRALARLGRAGTGVHRGPPLRSRWSSLVCFAGVGQGEVTAPGGAKVVGMAQRRTKAGAIFQCAVPLVWEPGAIVNLLALGAGQRQAARTDLGPAVAPLTGVDGEEVVSALVAALPTGSGRVQSDISE